MAGLLQDIKMQNIEWLDKLRAKGLSSFKKNGIPTAKTEAWKYTKLREVVTSDFVVEDKAIAGDRNFSDFGIDAYKIEFLNGRFVLADNMPFGVELKPILEAPKEVLGKLIDVEKYPFAALNTAYINEGVFIKVGKNVKTDKPLAFINKTSVGDKNLFYNIRNLIMIEDGAEIEFIEDFIYSGDIKSRYLSNIANEIYIGNNAVINHYKVQDEAYKANHITLNVVDVRNNGTYNSYCLQKGANLARNETKVLLKEQNAVANINVAYIMNGWATIDTTTDIEHLSPYTFSNQLVKGVVGGEARGVFQGKIHIAKNAIKTEGNQLHRALLLSNMAEVDCKPELEIFADDVKCSHGAATGVLDEMQLFYMCSRGISREDAKQMLIDAYLDDVLNKISNNALYIWIKDRIK